MTKNVIVLKLPLDRKLADLEAMEKDKDDYARERSKRDCWKQEDGNSDD
jgi:hypothetical protein